MKRPLLLKAMMHELLRPYFADLSLRGSLAQDVTAVLTHHQLPRVAEHVSRVAAEARRLALRFGADPNAAETAAWLHDIGAVIPNDKRLALAAAFDVEVLPEEAEFLMILHQKLSAVVAAEVFAVTDTAVLRAIGCHTTLKANASLLDKVLFVADKIAWDQTGTPPYLAEIETAVAHSLDAAALCYLDYLWQRRHSLRVVHPWMAAAYRQLSRHDG